MALAGDIAEALQCGNVLLCADPGAGKSTGLPLALLLDTRLEGKIILLEPRRLAARSVAERLASHVGEKVGQRVGLRMRSDTRVSGCTRLQVVTEGVLTRLLQDDPSLDGVALVIFDEFHERSLQADLGLTLCLEVQRALRNDLRLMLMSATLETDQLQSHLGSIRQFHSAVRQHRVDVTYLGDYAAPLPLRVARTVYKALSEHTGDVLVFLPGVAEINRTAALLHRELDDAVTVHRLHSGVSPTAQDSATAPATPSRRRVILATSLAETSITIDGVQVVVDSGLERRSRIDSAGAQRLETVMASQASATQRTGRAGRTAVGVCYRLWSESSHARRPTHWEPEIRRADLSPVMMELGLWGATVMTDLPWLEPPPAAGLSRASELLSRLGLWEGAKLTARGRCVAALALHPRLGHMLVWAAEHDCLSIGCRLAVLLEDQPRGSETVDLESVLHRRLPPGLQRQADLLASRLEQVGRTRESAIPATYALTAEATVPSPSVVLAQAFPDWIAQRRPGDPGRFTLACGAGAVIDSEDMLAHAQWLVVAQLGGGGTQARIFKAMLLNIDELQRYAPELFTVVDYLDWDDRQQRVLAESRSMIGNLIVNARPLHDISAADKAVALAAGIRKLGMTCLPWTEECRQWQARALRMRELPVPASVGQFPAVDDQALVDEVDSWLLPWLQGIGSMKALQQLDLYKALKAILSYSQQILMDDWLPLRFTVPSGSQIRLNYTQTGNPVLSVRLQEMLGCSENPTIAQGALPLKVELLSPARRPVQVTEDLANFWTNSYPAVRKEMAGRYPRHVWPDDPLAAQPTRSAKRRK